MSEVKNLKTEKTQLESEITKVVTVMIADFSKSTGLLVDRVDIDISSRQTIGGEKSTIITGTRVSIDL